MSLIFILGLIFMACSTVALFETGKVLRFFNSAKCGLWVVRLIMLSTTLVVVGLSVVLINVLIISESHANLINSQHVTFNMEDTD